MAEPIRIPWGAWFGDEEKELTFPSEWEARLFPPRDAPEIGDEAIRQAFARPYGTPPLRELARGRQDAVIVVDDLSRPTPAARLLPIILDELAAGGIGHESVRVIMGIAAHRPLMREDCIKKLGREMVDLLEVKNHNVFENVAYLGKTSRGTPVYLNRDFLAADLKICLGSINPHGGPGFGGGAKLVLPGVAGIESLYQNHRGDNGLKGGLNNVETNDRRTDMEEAARIGKLDAIINVVVNSRRGIAGLFVGDVVEAHRAGVALAREVFATPVPEGWDVGIFNAYPKDNEFVQAGMAFNIWGGAKTPIVREEGTVVLCSAASEGVGYHALHGPGMRLPGTGNMAGRFVDRRMVIFSPGINRRDLSPATRDAVTLCRAWEEVIAALRDWHGAGTRVAVFPCSAIQLAVPPQT
jgi:nickel-dependent lactate racemase